MRVTLAQLLDEEPRPIGEILLDVAATFDAIMRHAKTQLRAGETVTVEELDRLIELGNYARQAAKTVVDAGVQVSLIEQRARDMNREARTITDAVVAAVDAVIDLVPVEHRTTIRGQALHAAFVKMGGQDPAHVALPAGDAGAGGVGTVVDAEVVDAEIG
jgi:hypothetical protein